MPEHAIFRAAPAARQDRLCLRILKSLAASLAMAITLLPSAQADPLPGHPRLWIRASDVPRIRTWAVPSNPMYQQGLSQLVASGVALMDAPGNPLPNDDPGGGAYSGIYTEAYAGLFAFMSLAHPDAMQRSAFAARGRQLLMHIVNRVDSAACQNFPPNPQYSNPGPAPFCTTSYAVSDRMRWAQVSLPLSYDWLMGHAQETGTEVFSPADKAAIRRVFLRWVRQNMEGYPNPYQYSAYGDCNLPLRTTGDALLRLNGTDPNRYCKRYAFNNYYMGHMRQIGMLSMAFDAADDVPDTNPLTSGRVLAGAPAGELTGYRNDALNGWLHMAEYILKNDGAGSQPPEGAEYAPTSGGIPTHLLLSLYTARYNDAAGLAQWGQKVDFGSYAFFTGMAKSYLAQLAPYAVQTQHGRTYQPAWFGDGEQIYALDFITVFGPIGLYSYYKANEGGPDAAFYAEQWNAIRWMQTHVPPNGAAGLYGRARSEEEIAGSILYFLLFDPAAPAPTDPRPNFPRDFYSAGPGRLSARTDWNLTGTRWFNYRLGWTTIDHQNPDGNLFDFYRKGEWLTKEVTGYGAGAEAGRSDYKNTLTVQNDPQTGLNYHTTRRFNDGSQFVLGAAAGDPVIVARSVREDLAYVLGDATNLYNYCNYCWETWGRSANGVQHVSRSLVWLKPDIFVVYDRARTAQADRFKRFWLNLPNKDVTRDTIDSTTGFYPGWQDAAAGQLPAGFGGSGVAATTAMDGATVLTTGTTPRGQKLFVRTLLPLNADAAIITAPDCFGDAGSLNPLIDSPQYGCTLAVYDAMTQKQSAGPIEYHVTDATHTQNLVYATRLRVQPPANAANVRFLHVVEGADPGAAASPAQRVASIAGTAFDGAVVAGRTVLFPVDVGAVAGTTWRAPKTAPLHVVTGLAPDAAYGAAVTDAGTDFEIALTPGGALRADAGGVLVFTAALAGPVDTVPDAFTFAPETGVATGSTRTSAAAAITGINAPAPVTVSGGSYCVAASADCGACTFGTAPGTVSAGQFLCLRHTAAASAGSTVTTYVTVGGLQSAFASTTAAAAALPPGAPGSVTAVAGNGSATVSFAAPASNGGGLITGYTATASPGGLTAACTGADCAAITLPGLTNGQAYTITVTAANAAGTGPASAPSNSVTPTGLALTGVRSEKLHGGAGAQSVALATGVPIGGAISIEPRAAGGSGHLLVFSFGAAVTSVATASVTGPGGAPVGSATWTIDGNDVRVRVTGVPEVQRATVTLTGVNGGLTAAVSLGFALGDVSATGAVTAADLAALRQRNGAAAASQYRFDLDASGTVGPEDLALAKPRAGQRLP